MNLGQRFARLATDAVVRRPSRWRVFRGSVRRQFDSIAPSWDARRDPAHLAPLEAALATVGEAPRTALDLGTGTGAAAIAVAERWPGTEVTGVDMAAGMLDEARRKLPRELAGRVRFVAADAASLPFRDGAFELVTLANMIPFFDELARVTAPGGFVAFSFSIGSNTPIYVPSDRLRRELEARGFSEFAHFQAGPGTAFLARKREPR